MMCEYIVITMFLAVLSYLFLVNVAKNYILKSNTMTKSYVEK